MADVLSNTIGSNLPVNLSLRFNEYPMSFLTPKSDCMRTLIKAIFSFLEVNNKNEGIYVLALLSRNSFILRVVARNNTEMTRT